MVDTPASDAQLSNAGGLGVDSEGRPHAAFVLEDSSGRARIFHVWRHADGWRREQVGELDGGELRPSVVTTSTGSVHVLVSTARAGGTATAWLVDVTPGRSERRDVRLLELPVDDWELTFDTRLLDSADELALLVPGGTSAGDPSRPVVGDAGGVVVFDAARLPDGS